MLSHTTTQIIAKEGWSQSVFTLMLFVLSYTISCVPWFFFGIFIFTLFLYRNPERLYEEEDEYSFLSPCDGKIIDIQKVTLKEGTQKLSVVIQKSIFNVGILRAPMTLSILETHKRNGLFLPRTSPLALQLGEKNTLTCRSVFGEIKLVLRCGAWSQKMELIKSIGPLKLGQRFAFLNEGDVTLLLPLDARLKVSLNDDVKAGTTVLGYFDYKGHDDK
ncbi:MAG: phosphatidylserine decarboxylase [Sulfurospirillaceae bacterium]|nr:phosphatidylserine decarboxylase [Sulfurospirillaceae bacterium]MDD2826372.1 phosphatidylserine decarboxylase [Sulfurospirillaceae bacterium]